MRLTQEDYRYFLKDSVRLAIDFSETDQSRGKPAPPIQKSVPAGLERIDLVPINDWSGIARVDITSAIAQRQSVRNYTAEPLTRDELSYLLWTTQGLREIATPSTAFRTVPSAGCRHSFETYICAMNITGLEPGVYRYLPIEHQLATVVKDPDIGLHVAQAALGQAFTGKAAATFVWTTIPYRMEWRYGLAAHKVIAIDIGHVCQNLYLACAAIKAGTCAVAAYNQTALDKLLGVDGKDEFALYLASVGKTG
ncbi:MAG TPA: SagB/ThcOx family dehydrogenase [Nitrospirota bacterium]|nr:SagB/ThcOx family dehydrogenase [Nitrospirota bacterium]